MLYKYFYIFIAALSFVACNPANKLARELKIDKLVIESILKSTGSRGKYFERKDKYIVNAYNRRIGPKDLDTTLYTLLGNFDAEDIRGPFLENDSRIFYLKKTATTQKEFVSIVEAQIWQPFGIGDDLFHSVLDSIVHICINEQRGIGEVLDEFESEFIGKGIVYTISNKAVDKLKAEAITFIRDSPKLSLLLYRKDELPTTAIAIYFQKIEEIKTLDIYNYNYIRIDERKENEN